VAAAPQGEHLYSAAVTVQDPYSRGRVRAAVFQHQIGWLVHTAWLFTCRGEDLHKPPAPIEEQQRRRVPSEGADKPPVLRQTGAAQRSVHWSLGLEREVEVALLEDLDSTGAPLAAEDLVAERVHVNEVFKLLVMMSLRSEGERAPGPCLDRKDVQGVASPAPTCDHELLLGVFPQRSYSDRPPQAAGAVLPITRHPGEALPEDAEAPQACARAVGYPKATITIDAETRDIRRRFVLTAK